MGDGLEKSSQTDGRTKTSFLTHERCKGIEVQITTFKPIFAHFPKSYI